MEKVNSTIEEALKASFNDLNGQNYPNHELRKESLDKFLQLGLPGKKNEEYKFTPAGRILERNFDFEAGDGTWDFDPKNLKSQFFAVDGYHMVFVNGQFQHELSELNDQVIQIEEIAKPIDAIRHTSAFYFLNGAFNHSHIRISIKQNVELPLFIYHFYGSDDSQVICHPKIDIEISNQGSVDIIEKSIIDGTNKVFSNATTTISIGANAKINLTKLQDLNNSMYLHDEVYLEQERDSRSYINTYSFKGALIRNNLNVSVNAENCETHLYGLYLLNGKTHVDNHTTVDHLKPNSYSNELYKGIIDEQATAVFNGKIYVRPGAQQTNAFQTNNNISISEDTKIHSKPQLEIWADDVKCSHGCTVGQLDEEAVFYLRSRGLSEKSATAMMLHAFSGETLENVPVQLVKDEVVEIVNERLR